MIQAQIDNKQLDDVLNNADPLLLDSLRREDADKKRRRLRYVGIAAFVLLATIAGVMAVNRGVVSAEEDLVQRGWSLWQSREMQKAEAAFTEAVRVQPESDSAWNGLGWSRLNQGKAESSLEAFEACLKLTPTHPAALNGMGQGLLSLRKYQEAEEYLTRAAPQAQAAWSGLARVTLLTGQFEAAEKWCQKVVNLQPEEELAQQMLAAAKARKLSAELRGLIEPPDQIQIQVVQGWQQMNTGNTTEAEKTFKAVLESQAENVAAMNGLGFLYLNRGDVAKAKPFFEKCVKLQPGGGGPENGLARCLKAEGKVDEAAKLWKALDESTEAPNAGTVGLAYLYLESGEYAQAKGYFERLVKSQPQNDEYRARLKSIEVALSK